MFNMGFPSDWSTLRKLIWLRAALLRAASAVIRLVTGSAPLTLTNAVSHAIHSLTQFGKCTQASTPTPDAPVDIMCNNGALRMVDDELPSGYKRLLGITFDGDFHYRTGEYLTGDDDVTMTLDNLSASGKNVFGSYNGANEKNFSMYIYGSATSGSYFRYGDQIKRPKYGGTGRRTITFGASGTSGFAEDSDVTPDEFTTPANTYIGMLPNSSSAAYTGDIVGSILVSNRLEWIPTERETDGVIGYYEKYNGNFIAPTGSGTPVSLGYDYTHSHLAVVGTPEVLTVSATGAETQTVTNLPMLLSVGDYKDEAELISGLLTHKVGIRILTGEETGWALSDKGTTHRFKGTKPSDCYTPAIRAPSVCTHFKYNSIGAAVGGMFIGVSSYWYFIPTDQTIDAPQKWTAWLAAQYAAGTPVIVLYPLATDQTEQGTPHALHTSEGDNVVDVTANVDPVELECEYYGTPAEGFGLGSPSGSEGEPDEDPEEG